MHVGRARLGLIGIVVLGGALRFGTLDVQSYWDDEGHTVLLLRRGFGDMLSQIPHVESAPYAYYLAAWTWSQAFGLGEVGLRSFSALAGTLAIPLTYLATRELASARAGLMAAGVVAVNPLLIWYSQEARAYSLLVLFSAASLLFFARALKGVPRSYSWWAIVSSAALATHYFALFPVGAEALILLWVSRGRVSSLRGPLALLGATALLLLPLALVQRGKEFGFVQRSLVSRSAQVPEQLLVGYGIWSEWWGKAAAAFAAILVAFGLVALVWRRNSSGGAFAIYALLVGLAGVLAPFALALVGLDYVLTLYFVGAMSALAAATAAGWSLTRLGVPVVAAYCTLCLGIVAVVNLSPQFQREDLRGASAALGRTCDPRAIVISPESVIGAYVPDLVELPVDGALVREVAVIGMPIKEPGRRPTVPRDVPVEPAGFSEIDRVTSDRFTVVSFRAPSLRPVQVESLVRSRLGSWPYERVDVYLEPGC